MQQPPLLKAREFVFKIILVGDCVVGKSAIILQYTDHRFLENTIMTIGSDFRVHRTEWMPNNAIIREQIWDLSGSSQFAFIRPTFFRGTSCGIFVFDITSRASFENLELWIVEVSRSIHNCPSILVGNKWDLWDERVVSTQEAVEFATNRNMIYIECSAKLNYNIDTIFLLADMLLMDRI